MRELWPSLEMIQARFEESASVESVLAGQASAPGEASAVAGSQPSAVLASLFARREAAAACVFGDAPGAGQIVVVATTRDARPLSLAVLLDAPGDDGLWSAWVVSPDTDYASWWDVLLDHRDEPFDPSAGMIQVWNRLRLRVPAESRVLARLSAERLKVVRALSDEFRAGRAPGAGEDAAPGIIAPRAMPDGELVLSGTPMGNVRDPRRLYQSLHMEAANRLRSRLAGGSVLAFPVRGEAEASPEDEFAIAALAEPASRPRHIFRQPKRGWLAPLLWVAGIAMLAQAVAIVLLLRGGDAPDVRTQDVQMAASATEVLVKVRFRSAAGGDEVLRILGEVKGRVMNGPTAAGEYLVGLPESGHAKALDYLRGHEAVESVGKM